MKYINLLILAMFLFCCCESDGNNHGESDEFTWGYLLNSDSYFAKQMEPINRFNSNVNYPTKRKMILAVMADLYWNNTFDTTCISIRKEPGAVGVSYEMDYNGYEIYRIYQSEMSFIPSDDRITAIEIAGNHYITYSLPYEQTINGIEKPNYTYLKTPSCACLNELSYFLAIRETPFEYFAIANVMYSDDATSILDSLLFYGMSD